MQPEGLTTEHTESTEQYGSMGPSGMLGRLREFRLSQSSPGRKVILALLRAW